MHGLNHRGSFIKYCLKDLTKLFQLRIENPVRITWILIYKCSL